MSGVAWLSWMSGLVPEEIRGRFFGLRNSVLGLVTITVALAGGWFSQNAVALTTGPYINSVFIAVFLISSPR
jgi:hypothetical protein